MNFPINIIDIAAIVILLLVVFISAKKGFMKTFLTLAAAVVSYVGAKIASVPVSEYIYSNYISTHVLAKLNELIPSGSVAGEIDAVLDNLLASFPEALVEIARTYNLLPDSSVFVGASGDLTTVAIEQDYLAPFITGVVAIITTILLFLVLSAILRIVVHLINKLFVSKKHKFVKGTNMLLGAVLGAVKGIIPVGIIGAMLNIVAPASGNAQFIELVNSSYLCNLIAEIF